MAAASDAAAEPSPSDGGGPGEPARVAHPLDASDLAATLAESTQRALRRVPLADAAALARFLDPRLEQLTPPDGMADLEAAAERLEGAVRRRERVVVFGDYDCDGITAAAILTDGLRQLGAEAVPELASRFDGGYGVSAAAIARIRALDPGLLVTCDTGSSDHEALAVLRAAHVDVVVIDHHLVPPSPLPAVAFLNPHRPECRFAYKGLASCGLVIHVLAALRRRLGARLRVADFLDLTAIGTIADVAPLDGDNRVLVRHGLARLASSPRPGVAALRDLCGLGGPEPISAREVGFRLAPRLNAPGRVGSPRAALELLLAPTPEIARARAAEVEGLMERRKRDQERIEAEVESELGSSDAAALVVGRAGWNHGVVGIVAAKLVDRLARPVVVVAFDEQGVGVGSCRGPTGARLHDALGRCAATLERWGGHQAAAGMTVRRERFADFSAAFLEACAALPAPPPSAGAREVPWADGDDPRRVVAELAQLEPCGAANPEPSFALEVRILGVRALRGGHRKLDLELAGGHSLSAFVPASVTDAIEPRGRARLVGRLGRDRYRGGGAVELSVERVDR